MSDHRRRCLEDLVRIDFELGRELERLDGRLGDVSTDGSWTPAEHALHIIMALEYAASRFKEIHAAGGRCVEPPPLELKKSAARVMVLTTFRIPSGVAAPKAVTPRVLLPSNELVTRSRAARDELVELVSLADRSREECWVAHFALGPMSFVEWVRFSLIHSLHHFRILKTRFA